jgi:hypothetical protein
MDTATSLVCAPWKEGTERVYSKTTYHTKCCNRLITCVSAQIFHDTLVHSLSHTHRKGPPTRTHAHFCGKRNPFHERRSLHTQRWPPALSTMGRSPPPLDPSVFEVLRYLHWHIHCTDRLPSTSRQRVESHLCHEHVQSGQRAIDQSSRATMATQPDPGVSPSGCRRTVERFISLPHPFGI